MGSLRPISNPRSRPFERPSPSFLTRNFRVLAWAFTVVLVLVAAGLFWSSRSQPPRITGYTQITHDGRAKGFGGLVAGGERLYIQEIELDRFVISEVSVSGGRLQSYPRLCAIFQSMTSLRAGPHFFWSELPRARQWKVRYGHYRCRQARLTGWEIYSLTPRHGRPSPEVSCA